MFVLRWSFRSGVKESAVRMKSSIKPNLGGGRTKTHCCGGGWKIHDPREVPLERKWIFVVFTIIR